MKKVMKKAIAAALTVSVAATMLTTGAMTAQAETSTGVGLAAHALTAYREGWQYVWGGTSYGTVDCSGLIYTYNCVGGNRVDMLGSSSTWGYVSNGVPRIHGLGLHTPGHVGVYIGSGMAVDARDEYWGVVYHNVYNASWVEWFKIAGVSYPENGWVLLDGDSFYYEDGEYLVSTSRTLNGVTYSFDSAGVSDIAPPSSEYEATDYSTATATSADSFGFYGESFGDNEDEEESSDEQESSEEEEESQEEEPDEEESFEAEEYIEEQSELESENESVYEEEVDESSDEEDEEDEEETEEEEISEAEETHEEETSEEETSEEETIAEESYEEESEAEETYEETSEEVSEEPAEEASEEITEESEEISEEPAEETVEESSEENIQEESKVEEESVKEESKEESKIEESKKEESKKEESKKEESKKEESKKEDTKKEESSKEESKEPEPVKILAEYGDQDYLDNNYVSKAQKKLYELGYYAYAATGYFDEELINAVMSFQSLNNLEVTGRVDEKTLKALDSKDVVSSFIDLYFGDYDEYDSGRISALQRRLAELEYYYGDVNGYYNELTVRAVEQFQIDNDMDATGNADENVLRMIFKTDAEHNPNAGCVVYGSDNDETGKMIARLVQLRYLAAAAGNTFNDEVLEAVKLFQRTAGFEESDIVTPEMLEALYAEDAQNSPEYDNLKLGYKGDDVAKLQEKLASLKYYDGKNSGIFTADLEEAVKKFQQDNGLDANGIADLMTVERIEDAAVKEANKVSDELIIKTATVADDALANIAKTTPKTENASKAEVKTSKVSSEAVADDNTNDILLYAGLAGAFLSLTVALAALISMKRKRNEENVFIK